jgi:hypothetical protein
MLQALKSSAGSAQPRLFTQSKKIKNESIRDDPNCNGDLFVLARDGSGKEGSTAMEQVKFMLRVIRFPANPGADLKANVRLQVNIK